MTLPQCLLCGSYEVTLCPSAPFLYLCQECDLIFKDKSLFPSKSDERKRYENHQNTLANLGYVRMLEAFIKVAVTPYVKPPARILDFGSGPEPVLKELLKKHGYKADCYDPFFAPAMASAIFDLITCTEVIEHVHKPLETWKLMVSLLVPRGTLALMTHFHTGTQYIDKWWYIRDATHVAFYSEKTFAWLSAALGMTIEYSDGVKTIVLKLKA